MVVLDEYGRSQNGYARLFKIPKISSYGLERCALAILWSKKNLHGKVRNRERTITVDMTRGTINA